MKGIAELLDEFEASRNVDRDPRVGPSDYGSCPRQIMYRVRGHELGEQRTSSRAATMGTLFWQGLGGWIAEQYPDAIVEQHVDVPGLERGGSVDLRWRVDGVIVDVKTVSERAFDRVLTVGAKPENVGQLETYALSVNRKVAEGKRLRGDLPVDDLVPVHTLTLAYVNRDTGAVEEISWAYDEATAREKLSELVHIEQMIDDGHELPRAEGARLGAFPCDWCPFWRECWDVHEDEVPDDYASKFIVDDDPQIEAAIERYLDASATESKAKMIKAEARDQLVGIAYAANGYKLSWSGGRVTYEDEIDHEALVALAVRHGIEVPLRQVEKRTARRINLKRVQQ